MVSWILLIKFIFYVPIMVIVLNFIVFKNQKQSLKKVCIYSYLTFVFFKLVDLLVSINTDLIHYDLTGLTIGFIISYAFIFFIEQKS